MGSEGCFPEIGRSATSMKPPASLVNVLPQLWQRSRHLLFGAFAAAAAICFKEDALLQEGQSLENIDQFNIVNPFLYSYCLIPKEQIKLTHTLYIIEGICQ